MKKKYYKSRRDDNFLVKHNEKFVAAAQRSKPIANRKLYVLFVDFSTP